MTLESIVSLEQSECNSRPPPLSFREGKGHVSVNTTYGCGIACPFCISRADPWGTRVANSTPLQTLASPDRILDDLQRHAESVAPFRLSLLDFSDPFTPRIEPVLRELLSGLADRLPGQAVLLTTRLAPKPGLLDLITEVGSILHVSLFVSLGDATGGIEPVTPVAPRLTLLRESARRGVHTVMLLRPLAREWVRTSDVRELLAFAADTCHEIVLGGLQTPPEVERSLRKAGWPLPSYRSPHGAVEPSLRNEVVALAEELGDLPVSEHRSCAVNRFHEIPCFVARRNLVAARCLDIGDEVGALKATRCLDISNGAQPPAVVPMLCDFFDVADGPAPLFRADKCDMESERCRVDAAHEEQLPIVARPCQLGPRTCQLDIDHAPIDPLEAGSSEVSRYKLDLGDRPHPEPIRAHNIRDGAGYCRLKIAA